MGPDGRLVGIGLEVVTGKIRAIAAKADPFLLGTFENTALIAQTFGGRRSFFIPTSLADSLFDRQIQELSHRRSQLIVGIGQEGRTIETIQPAGGGHL
jgi:hypothetical protein